MSLNLADSGSERKYFVNETFGADLGGPFRRLLKAARVGNLGKNE